MTSALRAVFSTRFSASPATQQGMLVDAFNKALPATHLVRWAHGDSLPAGVFVLVGVMIGWNRYDQELAAALDEALADGRTHDDIVGIVAADGLDSPEAVQAVFPGLDAARGPSPYLAYWEDGRLRLVDHGASAAAFLSDRYGLSLP